MGGVRVSGGKGHQGQKSREGAEGKGRSLLDRDPSILVHLKFQLRVPGDTGGRVMPWEQLPEPPPPVPDAPPQPGRPRAGPGLTLCARRCSGRHSEPGCS